MPTGSRAERFAAVTDLNIPWRDETMDAYSSIFIDDREQERASAKPMIDESVVTGDLTELVSGSVAAKLDPQKPVAFVFRGLAIGDYAIAALGYERALEKGLGTLVEG